MRHALPFFLWACSAFSWAGTAPATRAYVHTVQTNIGLGPGLNAPLSAELVARIRSSNWATDKDIVSGDELALRSETLSRQVELCGRGPCLQQLAQAAGCSVTITMDISKVGGSYLLDGMVVDVASAEVLARATEQVKGGDPAVLLGPRGVAAILTTLLNRAPDVTPPEPGEIDLRQQEEGSDPPAGVETIDPGPVTTAPTPSEVTGNEQEPVAATVSPRDPESLPARSEPVVVATESPEDPESRIGPGPVLRYGGLGIAVLGGVAIVAGGVAYAAALAAVARIRAEPHPRDQLTETIEAGQLAQTVAWTLLGAGSLTALVGLGAFGGGTCLVD